MRLIEKLKSYSSSPDGIHWYSHPTKGDIEEKINEIIDVVNALTSKERKDGNNNG